VRTELEQLLSVDEGEEQDQRVWRYSLLTLAVCITLFALLVMPAIMSSFFPPGKAHPGSGEYIRRLHLEPGEQLLADYGPDWFPNNTFTNLKGDTDVLCQHRCFDQEYFIGVQSHMLYHGLANVSAGKPERPARMDDVNRH
jgi:hypothetical protein